MISAVCAVPRGACAPQPRAAKGGAADSDAEDVDLGDFDDATLI